MQAFSIALHGRGWHRHPYGTPPAESERIALCVYFLSTLLGAAMSVFGKLCSQDGVHVFQLVFARSATLCLLTLPRLISKRINPFRLDATAPLRLLRGVCGWASLSLLYTSLQLLPLSDAKSLSFCSPVLVALAAPWVLGERTPRAVYAAMPACLGGMLLVAQPSWLFGAAAVPTSALGVAAGALQAAFSAGSKLTVRALNAHQEPLESTLFSMGLICALGAAASAALIPGAQLTAVPCHSAAWAYLGATSALAFVLTLTWTLCHCNAATAASLDYASLGWTLAADTLVFHSLPSPLSLAGAAVIAAASLGSILWTGWAGQGKGRAPQDEAAAAARPQLWKLKHYLSPPAGSKGSSAAACSEDEAVSLIAAGAVAERGAAALAAALAAKEAACAVVQGGPGIGSDRHAGTLALSDSSKSGHLSQAVAAAVGGAAEAASAADGGPVAAGTPDGTTSVEVQAVSPGPGGMRTSSEKEQALQAAGR